MKQKKMTLRGRALRATLAFALAAGLIPSQALTSTAFAAGSDQPGEGASAIHSEDVVLDSSSQSNVADASGNAAGPDAASGADAMAGDAGEGAADAAQAEQGAPESDAKGAFPAAAVSAEVGQDDILRVQVDLNQSAASTAIAFGGLTYIVNDDGEDTVTLTGWTGTAPKGALTVPAQITSGATTYKVSRIAIAGGGPRILRFPALS